MRDVEGDQKIGRKTLPITFGVERARTILLIIFVLVSFSVITLHLYDGVVILLRHYDTIL